MVPIPTLTGITFVNSLNIIRCAADNNYTRIHLRTGKVLTASKTLKDYEIILENCGFFRCHRSHLINIKYVEEYRKGKNPYLILKGKNCVELAKNKRKEFFDLFK